MAQNVDTRAGRARGAAPASTPEAAPALAHRDGTEHVRLAMEATGRAAEARRADADWRSAELRAIECMDRVSQLRARVSVVEKHATDAQAQRADLTGKRV